MTERENALKVYRHELPEWIPILFRAVQHVGFWAGNENGLRGKKVGDAEALDEFGMTWTFRHGAPMPLPDLYLIDDIRDWRNKIKIPDVSSWDWEFIAEQETKKYDPDKVIVYFCEQGMFDRLVTLMGFEKALVSLFKYPDDCMDFFNAVADYKIQLVEYVARYMKPDVFMYTDDIAKNDGLFMSPDTYRLLLKPAQTRIIRAIKEFGMIPEQHTCGKCEAVLDDYVEIGIESFFPAQPSNDLVALKRKYGNKVVICGGFDTQGACAHIDAPDDVVRREARRMVDSYGPGGGFIAAPLILSDEDSGTGGDVLSPSQLVYLDEFDKYAEGYYARSENRIVNHGKEEREI